MKIDGNEHIVALCGSQRSGSHTHSALDRALSAARNAGATTDLVDIAALDLPLFDPEAADAGDAVDLRHRVRDADGVVLGTPMYHGSYSSVLKTALDYCGFEEFEETTVGLLVVSGGGFPTPALEHLRMVARSLDAWVLPEHVAIPNANTAFDGDCLTDERLAERVDALGTAVVDYAGVESYAETTAACAVPTAD